MRLEYKGRNSLLSTAYNMGM